jgi:hypothetical protein
MYISSNYKSPLQSYLKLKLITGGEAQSMTQKKLPYKHKGKTTYIWSNIEQKIYNGKFENNFDSILVVFPWKHET